MEVEAGVRSPQASEIQRAESSDSESQPYGVGVEIGCGVGGGVHCGVPAKVGMARGVRVSVGDGTGVGVKPIQPL